MNLFSLSNGCNRCASVAGATTQYVYEHSVATYAVVPMHVYHGEGYGQTGYSNGSSNGCGCNNCCSCCCRCNCGCGC